MADSPLPTTDDVAELKKQISDLQQVLRAFRIDEKAALSLVNSNSAIWLDRAGLYAAALVDAYRAAPPATHRNSNSALMKMWLDGLPHAAPTHPEPSMTHQDHVSDRWLAPLMKPA